MIPHHARGRRRPGGATPPWWVIALALGLGSLEGFGWSRAVAAEPAPDGGPAPDAAAAETAPAAAPAVAPARTVPAPPATPTIAPSAAPTIAPPAAPIAASIAAPAPPVDDEPPPPAGDQADLDPQRDQGQLDSIDLASLLENVVVSATKSELREDEAPAITTVITREEIRRWGYQSVSEILTHVAGVYVIDDHILPNVGIRGISGGLRSESGLIKVMIDGRSVAFRSTAGNWLGAELIPMSAIQQVEIIRGPASALYGADAFLGIINIVTRRPEQLDGGEGSASSTYRQETLSWDEDVTVGTSAGRWAFLGSFRNTADDHSGLKLPPSSPDPAVPAYAPADGTAHQLTQGSQVALGSLSYRLGAQATATLTGYYSAIDRGAEFADWQQLTHNIDSSGRTGGTDISLRQGFGNLGLVLQPSPKLDLRFSGMVFAGGPTDRDRIEVGSDLYYVKRQFGYRGVELEAEANWRPRPSVAVLLGAGLISDREQLPTIYRVLKSSFGDSHAGDLQLDSGVGGDVTLWNPGAHALVVWTPQRRFSLTTGVRYDYHSVYGGQPSERIGGVVALAPNLHFKLLYGNAFKAPSPQLLYGSPITLGDISGNANLKPSHVQTVEGQLTYRPGAYVHLTSGLAYNYVTDQAEFVTVGLNQVAQNIARVQSISWESELKVDYRRKVAAYANLSFTRTWQFLGADPGYVASLTNYSNTAYPAFVAHVGASAMLPGLPLSIGLEGAFVSARPSSPTNTLEAGGEYFLEPYFVLGGIIRTTGVELLPNQATSLALIVRNALDARVTDPGFAGVDYPQLGRTVMLHLLQDF
jgi:outer membrane receptor for ferrienterochelin and colicins